MQTNKYLKAIKELISLTLDKEVLQAVNDGTLEDTERFVGLCLVTRQFKKAQAIVKKYNINI